jgi:membrane-bound lytic murein transglycosylase B
MNRFARALAAAVMIWPWAGVAAGEGRIAAPEGSIVTANSFGSAPEQTRPATSAQDFDDWLAAFRDRALVQGIAPGVFDRAFDGVQVNPSVIEKDRNQGEFTKPIWEYLDKAVSEDRIANGKHALSTNRDLLERIEATYGVDAEVVVAVWGLESSYGAVRGDIPVIEALATLAYDTRRGSFFEGQLIAALKILQAGDVSAGNMTGSWAGAMGHTQFIPTSYLEFAVDFVGDGRRDIWSDDPADALASTAAYLARSGWVRGQPWGVEVMLPAGFDVSLSGEGITRSAADWHAMGVRAASGDRFENHGAASILLPAGVRGAAFMIFPNFRAIEKYNSADAYVIGIGHLSDRIGGAGPLRADWPRGDGTLGLKERVELQERLTSAGFDAGGADGKIGPKSVAAVKAFQRSIGLLPDGYASLELLRKLR